VAVAVGAAPMLAPLLGSLIDERFGWRAIFFLLLAAGTALAIATHLALPETRRTDARRRSVGESLSDVGVLTRNRAFWAFTLVYTSSAGLFYSFFAGTAYASKYILSMSGTDYGYCFILVNLGYSLGAAATGRHARWIGVSRMIVIGGAIGLASTLMMALAFALGAHGALVYFGPMFTINLANGLMQSNAIASVASVRPNLAGTATGLAGALQVAFAAAATVSIGFRLAGIGRELAFALVATGFAALAFGAGLWSQRLSPDGLRS
jgi:DHA1 family bicyclomycin/chloramphenicol resistance-like MFS transporter